MGLRRVGVGLDGLRVRPGGMAGEPLGGLPWRPRSWGCAPRRRESARPPRGPSSATRRAVPGPWCASGGDRTRARPSPAKRPARIDRSGRVIPHHPQPEPPGLRQRRPRAPARGTRRGPAPTPARGRARAAADRLGPLGAHRGPDGPHARRVLLPLLVPRRGGGDRERARRGRRAAGVQPLGRAAAGRADDRQGDPRGAPPPAAAEHHRRALLQGLSGLLDADPQDRLRGRPPRQRAPAALRRGAAGARVPRGTQGHREALQGPLPPAPLRPRRLRGGRHAGAGADRAGVRGRRRGGGAGVRAARTC